jgi:uncharacterized coiled-coil protein SlyX
MDLHQRLTDLEKVLALRYETLGEAEKDLAMTTNTFEKTAIKQRLREQVLPDIQKYEQEYYSLLNQLGGSLNIDESDANQAIVELDQQVAWLETTRASAYSDEALQLLREIRDKLNEPGKPAAAKLKAAFSSIPPFISLTYEAEVDTESTLQRFFPTFSRLVKKATKK